MKLRGPRAAPALRAPRARQAAPGEPRPEREDGSALQLYLQPALRGAVEVDVRRVRHDARGARRREGGDDADLEEARGAAHADAGWVAEGGGGSAGDWGAGGAGIGRRRSAAGITGDRAHLKA